MATPEQAMLEELLQRRLDSDLRPGEARELERHLESSPELRREGRQLESLVELFEASRVPVEEGFRESVMASLPPAAWEARSTRAWRLPLALLAGLALGGAALAKLAQPAAGSLGAALAAVVQLVVMAALTGAGLLGASWTGLQAAVRGLVSDSPAALIGLGLLVVGLNVMLGLALRARARRPAAASEKPAPRR